MYVKTTFLHGDLKETIYMSQPSGFEVKGKEKQVCILKKSLYGLKQSSHQWYKRSNHYITQIGFTRRHYDSCLYFKDIGTKSAIYLLLYVDDMLITSASIEVVKKVKGLLSSKFDMKDLGNAKRILGIDIKRDRQHKVSCLSQKDYLRKVIKKFSMENSKSVKFPLAEHFKLLAEQSPSTEEDKIKMSKIPYASVVVSLMYSIICTRPYLAYFMSVLSKYMANLGMDH